MKPSNETGLSLLQKRVAWLLNKSPEDVQPFFKILLDNWYDSQESLQRLTLQDYERMKIPQRVAQLLIEIVGKGNQKPKPTMDMSQSEPVMENKMNKQPQNSQPVASQSPPLNQHYLLNLMGILMQNLMSKYNPQQAKSKIQILYKLISNIVKDPYQMKYRVLKKSNNTINQNIIQCPPMLEFLKVIGFEDSGENLQMNKFQILHLIFLEECLKDAMQGNPQDGQNRRGYTNQRNNSQQQSTNNQKMFLDVTKFPQNQSQIKQQFSQQKLGQMKYIDALQKLVQIRNNIMSQPLQNRCIRIYSKRFESKSTNVQQVSFEDQFQKSDNQLIAGYWAQMMANSKKSQNFQSKRKIEFEFLIKQKIYRQAIIKIKLPNQLIIEARFGPLQKLAVVFQLVAHIVIGDLYLFTAPPKKVMDKKELQKTLIDHDVVPTGSFYLGINGEYYIQQQYVGIIQK